MHDMKEILNRRADRVRGVELVDAAIAQGGRMRRRRTAFVAVAGLVAVGLVGVAVARIAPEGPPAPPATTPTPASSAWTAIPGTLTFADVPAGALYRVTDSATSADLGLDPDDVGSWTVSPVGDRISVVDRSGLRVGAVDGGTPPLVYEASMLCATHLWSPDGDEIMVGDCSKDTVDLVFVDAGTGEESRRVADVGDIGSVFYLGGGGEIGWGNGRDGYTVAGLDGADRRVLDVGELPEALRANGVVSQRITRMSEDGRYACHDVTDGASEPFIVTGFGDDPDPAAAAAASTRSTNDCDVLVDVASGSTAPSGGEEFDAVEFGPGGTVLVVVHLLDERTYEIRLLDGDLNPIDTRPLGPEVDLRALSLQSYL